MSEDPLTSEERKILNFMFANLSMSPRAVAEHFGVPVEQIYSILARDLRWVTSSGESS